MYKKRTETAKKEYLKALAAYRASLVSQVSVENENLTNGDPPSHPRAVRFPAVRELRHTNDQW